MSYGFSVNGDLIEAAASFCLGMSAVDREVAEASK